MEELYQGVVCGGLSSPQNHHRIPPCKSMLKEHVARKSYGPVVEKHNGGMISIGVPAPIWLMLPASFSNESLKLH